MPGVKVIAFFLSFIMFVQILPVQQIGNALGQNQWTKELPQGDDCSTKALTDCHQLNNPFLPPHDYVQINYCHTVNEAVAYILFSEGIPLNHSVDIVTPPPDCFI